MADNDIEVQIGANASGLNAGLSAASEAIKEAMGEINGSLASSVAVGTAVGEMIGGIVVKSFEALKNVITELIPEVQKEAAEVKKLANVFGTTVEEANKLNIALHLAGISGDEYVGMAMKLDKQLKTNESGMNKLGVATRDSNGHLLSQDEIMQNAAATLNQYKAGTDRNEVAMQLFGKSAAQAADLQRLNNDIKQRAIELAEKGIGVDKESTDAARAYTVETNTAKMILEEFGNKIAESVMPAITSVEQAFSRIALSVLPVFSTVFKALGIIFSAVGEVIKAVVDAISDVIDAMGDVINAVFGNITNKITYSQYIVAGFTTVWTVLKVIVIEVIEAIRYEIDVWKNALITLASILDRILHGDLTGAVDAYKAGAQHMIDVAKAHAQTMVQIAKEGAQKVADAWSGKGVDDKVSGGNKDAPDPAKTSKQDAAVNAAQKAALAEIAIEREKIDQLRALDQISEEQKTTRLIALADKEYAIELGTVNKLMAIHAGEKDKIEALESQKLDIKAKHALEVLKLRDGMAKEEYKIDRQLTEQSIASEEKKSLAIIASERETLKQKREINQITADEEVAGLLDLADREYQANLRAFNAKLMLYQNDKVQREKILEEMSQAEQKHANEVTKIYQDAAKEQIKINRQLSDEKIVHDQEMKQLDIDNQRDVIQIKYDLNQISNQQRLEALKKLLDDEYQNELDALQQKLELDNISVVEKQKTLDAIEKLQAKHNNQVLKMDGDLAKEQNAIWKSLTDQISRLWDKGIQAMMNGTLTLRNAMRAIFTQITGCFLTEVVGKQVKAWVFGENQMTAASLAGSAQRIAAKIGEAAQGVASMAASVIKSIMNFGAETFAGVWAALSGIPIIGPELAAAAAPAAMATVVGMTASVASASGGYDIPSGINPMTQLHQREMVLPAKYADTIRSMADNGVAGGGTTHIHINAIDAKSVSDLFKNNPNILAPALRRAQRNFQPSNSNQSPLGRIY